MITAILTAYRARPGVALSLYLFAALFGAFWSVFG